MKTSINLGELCTCHGASFRSLAGVNLSITPCLQNPCAWPSVGDLAAFHCVSARMPPRFFGEGEGGGSRTPTQRRVDRSRSTTWYRLPKARRSWPSTALTPEQNQLGLEGSRHVMRGAGCGAEGQKCARPEGSCSASGDALSTAGRMLQGVQHFHGFLHF